MQIGDFDVPATRNEKTAQRIDTLRRAAEAYGLTLSEFLLFLIYDEGIKVFPDN